MPEEALNPAANYATAASVRISDGRSPPQRFALTGQRMLIGRAPDADIRLDRNTISRYHAELFHDPFGRWWLRDLQSRNGLWLGQDRIAERALQGGDAVQVGEFTLTFSSQSVASPTAGSSTIPISDAEAQIHSLADLDPPKVAASHLAELIGFGRALLKLEDPARRLEQLCQLMNGQAFGARYGLALRVGEGDVAQVLCGPLLSEGWNGQPRVSKGLVQTARRTLRPALATDSSSDPQVVRMTIVNAGAAVACPLDESGSDLLYVALPPERGTSEWLAIASLAAEQYRSAESIWAARQQAQAQAAIEEELRQASGIQERLVPRNVSVPGLDLQVTFRACRWVGGDYVGIRRIGDSRVFLTVADVCGKGLPAALIASSLHSMIFAGVSSRLDLTALMNSMNCYLAEFLGDQSFVTMICVLLDVNSGAMQCANAGHPPPLIARRGEGVRWLPHGLNLPLGVASDPIITQEHQLEAGDVLMLYTDGISELPVSSGAWLGIEGVADELARICGGPARPLQDLGRDLDQRISDLQAGRVAQDDLTFLLASRCS